jgi:hypothetical protein
MSLPNESISLPTKHCRENYRLIMSDILRGNMRILPTIPNILQWRQTLHMEAVIVGLWLCSSAPGLKLLAFLKRVDKLLNIRFKRKRILIN